MKPATAILGLALLMNVGCAQEKNSGNASAPPPVVQPPCERGCDAGGSNVPVAPGGSGGSNGQGGYYSGATAAITNVQSLGELFFNSYPNNPQQIQVNIDMNRSRDSVIISYVDGGVYKEAGLGTQHPYSSHSNSSYNGWVTEGSSRVYKGFFQDEYGAVVVVIDKVLNVGDGQPAPYVGGSIWFQNFGDNPTYDNPHWKYWSEVRDRMCWQITYGPYDCRTFLVGSSVVMNSSPDPTTRGPSRSKTFKKLGNFNGLSRVLANLPAQ
jgi:hypothetical protein